MNRAGHFRRTKHGDLAWVEPHQVLAHIAEHGQEPPIPKNAHTSVWMGKQAMAEAIKGHNVVHAMHRTGIGWIDFIQGTPGGGPPEFWGGAGISHIKAKRDWQHSQNSKIPNGETTLKLLPGVIAKGVIYGNRSTKIEIRLGGLVAIVEMVPPTKENPSEHWLVSGFQKGGSR